MPFILCATICCCLPCIISALDIREDLSQNRGATVESINSLPVYKFKVKNNENCVDQYTNTALEECGVLAAGTEKERILSGKDAVSFIDSYIILKLQNGNVCIEFILSKKKMNKKLYVEPECKYLVRLVLKFIL
jgi:hypothetical protein